MNLGGACVVVVTALALSACGGATDSTTPTVVRIEPGSQAEAQAALDKAGAFVEKSGTGAFLLIIDVGRGIAIDGEWDLRAPATDFTMTMYGVDDGKDVVDRTRILDNAAFVQLPDVDDPMCWMKLAPADRTMAGMDAENSPVHPAARMLLEPHALGVVKDSRVAAHQDIRAEMAFEDAVSAAMPKVVNLLGDPLPDGMTVPVTIGIDAGKYESITYSMKDILRIAKDNGVDLFGSARGDADDVAKRMADAAIVINYRSFGGDINIAAPDPSQILAMNEFAELKPYGGTPETCAAAR